MIATRLQTATLLLMALSLAGAVGSPALADWNSDPPICPPTITSPTYWPVNIWCGDHLPCTCTSGSDEDTYY